MRYRIENIRQIIEEDSEGKIQKIMEIRYEIAKRYRGTVTLPKEEFTEEKAKKVVHDEALKLKNLMEMEGEI